VNRIGGTRERRALRRKLRSGLSFVTWERRMPSIVHGGYLCRMHISHRGAFDFLFADFIFLPMAGLGCRNKQSPCGLG